MTDIIIVEDEAIAAQHLQRILQEIIPDANIVTVLQSIEETVDYFKAATSTPNLVFMDFHLADGLATHIFEHVSIPCPVVFTTAYDEYALDAFRAGGVDYLLKPIDHDAVRHALEKISRLASRKWKAESGKWKAESEKENDESIVFNSSNSFNSTNTTKQSSNQAITDDVISSFQAPLSTPKNYPSHFLIPVRNKLIPVEVRQIACIYLEDKITRAILYDGRQQIIDRPLDALMDQLDPSVFFRANRQYIVAHRAIDDIAVWPISKLAVTLCVATPERIIISKARVHEFKQWYTK